MLLPRRPLVDSLERRQMFAAVLSDVGTQPTGPLSGKIIYAAAGHGFASNATGIWNTGRGLNNGMVEDMGNQDQLTYYADAAFRAGATVVPMRPVGHQTNEVIVDNPQATYTGAWSEGTATAYFHKTDGTGSRYRFAAASATETAVARFTPAIPAAGFYPVYAWAADGANRIDGQTYRVNHAGGATEVKVDHTRVGKGWVYLGTYRFNSGSAGNVEVSNKTSGTTANRFAIADAIRFGNGMGSVVRNGTTSGQSREDEASVYWIEAQAGFTSTGTRTSSGIWRSSTDDESANVSAPLRWAAYMNANPVNETNSIGDSVYVSFHSNAGGGRGADGLIHETDTSRTPNQVKLATYLGREVTNDMVALGSPPLEHPFANSTNPTFYGAFGEINGNVINDEFDATIIEVAFHDDVMDANIMKSPLGRSKIAQATLQGTQRYFNEFGGAALTFAPDAPTHVTAVGNTGNGNVVVSWSAPAASAAFGGAPTGYRVYASRDGYSFDGGQYVAGAATTSLKVFANKLGVAPVYFKVVAVNAGGESPASGVAAARPGDGTYGRLLIVNAFDRLDRFQGDVDALPITGTNGTTPGTDVNVVRVRPRAGNSFDYSVQHAQAIASAGYSLGFDTADNEALLAGRVNLASYNGVIWISGEESTADESFGAAEQNLVRNYLANGGKFMVSGSEVGYDLVAQNGGATFFNATLHSGYSGDDAGSYAATGTSGGIFAGLSLGFDNGTGSTYNVDFPDRLAASNGSTSALTYGTGGVAATAWSGGTANRNARTLVMGFGFETITDVATRNALMQRTLQFFGMNVKLAAGGATLAYGVNGTPEQPIGGYTAAFFAPLTRPTTTTTTVSRPSVMLDSSFAFTTKTRDDKLASSAARSIGLA